jgi:hypothetical protein
VLLRSGSCAEISPKPVSRELTPAGTSAHSRLHVQVESQHWKSVNTRAQDDCEPGLRTKWRFRTNYPRGSKEESGLFR